LDSFHLIICSVKFSPHFVLANSLEKPDF